MIGGKYFWDIGHYVIWTRIANKYPESGDCEHRKDILKGLIPECQPPTVPELMAIAGGGTVRTLGGQKWQNYAIFYLEAEVFAWHDVIKRKELLPEARMPRQKICDSYTEFRRCKQVRYRGDRVNFAFRGYHLETDRIWRSGVLTTKSVIREGWTLFLRCIRNCGVSAYEYIKHLLNDTVVCISRNRIIYLVCIPVQRGIPIFEVPIVDEEGELKQPLPLFLEIVPYLDSHYGKEQFFSGENAAKMDITTLGASSLLAKEANDTSYYPWKDVDYGFGAISAAAEIMFCLHDVVPPEIIMLLRDDIMRIHQKGRTQEKEYREVKGRMAYPAQDWYRRKQLLYAQRWSMRGIRLNGVSNSLKGEVHLFTDEGGELVHYQGAYGLTERFFVAIPRVDRGLEMRVGPQATLLGCPSGNFEVTRLVGHRIRTERIPLFPDLWTVWEVTIKMDFFNIDKLLMHWIMIYDVEKLYGCRPFKIEARAIINTVDTEFLEFENGVCYGFGRGDTFASLHSKAEGKR